MREASPDGDWRESRKSLIHSRNRSKLSQRSTIAWSAQTTTLGGIVEKSNAYTSDQLDCLIVKKGSSSSGSPSLARCLSAAESKTNPGTLWDEQNRLSS